MNINNSPLPLPSTTDLYQSHETQTAQRNESTARAAAAGATGGAADAIATGDETKAHASSDDVHLSELVRSLRSLASDSPDRQAKIEQLARSYAGGNYRADPQATAQGIIHDSFKS